jgi:hypothetical protein
VVYDVAWRLKPVKTPTGGAFCLPFFCANLSAQPEPRIVEVPDKKTGKATFYPTLGTVGSIIVLSRFTEETEPVALQ